MLQSVLARRGDTINYSAATELQRELRHGSGDDGCCCSLEDQVKEEFPRLDLVDERGLSVCDGVANEERGQRAEDHRCIRLKSPEAFIVWHVVHCSSVILRLWHVFIVWHVFVM